MICNSRFLYVSAELLAKGVDQTCLEPFILKNPFDGGVFTTRRQLGLEDDTKGPISNDFTLSILHLSCFSGQSILDFFTYNLCRHLSAHVLEGVHPRRGSQKETQDNIPPMRKPENTPPGLFCDIV